MMGELVFPQCTCGSDIIMMGELVFPSVPAGVTL